MGTGGNLMDPDGPHTLLTVLKMLNSHHDTLDDHEVN